MFEEGAGYRCLKEWETKNKSGPLLSSVECIGKYEAVKASGGSIEQHRDETMRKDIQPKWVGMRAKGVLLSKANASRWAWDPHPLYCLLKDIAPAFALSRSALAAFLSNWIIPVIIQACCVISPGSS